MSEPIKVGDLVMVMRNHCNDHAVGTIFQVRSLLGDQFTYCPRCGSKGHFGELAELEFSGFHNRMPLSWLKRIPPLEELQTYRQTDETTV